MGWLYSDLLSGVGFNVVVVVVGLSGGGVFAFGAVQVKVPLHRPMRGLTAVLLVGVAALATTLAEPEPVKQPEPLNMTLVAHHAGECAVGASCGAAAAFVLRKVQSMVVTLGIVGGISCAAALHLGWVHTDQLRLIGLAVVHTIQGRAAQLAMAADLDSDGDLTYEDSRIAYSRLIPHVCRRPALAGGLLGGFVTTFGAMR